MKLDSLVPLVSAVVVLTLIGCAAPNSRLANVVGDTDVGACDLGVFDALGRLDVAIVIDTSQSTRRPTEFDIDRDGFTYKFQRNTAIDRGDSWLAAEIAGARSLIRKAQGHDIRFSIITFAGPNVQRTVGLSQLNGSRRDSRMRIKLTDDAEKLDSTLTAVFEAGSDGKTIFFGGMQRAIRSLVQSRDPTRRKVVLFMSDAGRPNGLQFNGDLLKIDPRMKFAATVARNHGIVFHTFGLSPDSRRWRDESLGQIPGATGGTYHPIEDPRQLHCHLADALLPTYQQEQLGWQRMFTRYRQEQARSSGDPNRSGELSPDP
jgi:hypothetical protein